MTNILAIGKKQNKDTIKNKAIFMQFIIFPIIAFVMETAVDIPGLQENYFTSMFAGMFLGMAPLTAMASLMSEEKENATLRMLKMAGVGSGEYMLGAGGSLFGISFLGILVFAAIGALQGMELVVFLLVMSAGILISLMLGGTIGLLCKNQTATNSVAIPVMMIFSFLPMLAMFHDGIAQAARYTYTGQIQRLVAQTQGQADILEALAVIGINGLVAAVLFFLAYRKSFR